MADRFPSIEDLDNGTSPPHHLPVHFHVTLANSPPGDASDFGGMQDGTTNGGTFLDREKAALGADADAFTTPNDVPSVSVQDGFDDDLLGGGDGTNGAANDDLNQFQRSFPAVDTRNEVRTHLAEICYSALCQARIEEVIQLTDAPSVWHPAAQ